MHVFRLMLAFTFVYFFTLLHEVYIHHVLLFFNWFKSSTWLMLISYICFSYLPFTSCIKTQSKTRWCINSRGSVPCAFFKLKNKSNILFTFWSLMWMLVILLLHHYVMGYQWLHLFSCMPRLNIITSIACPCYGNYHGHNSSIWAVKVFLRFNILVLSLSHNTNLSF